MSITTNCQNCNDQKIFSDSKLGKRFKCPVCQEIVLVRPADQDVAGNPEPEEKNPLLDNTLEFPEFEEIKVATNKRIPALPIILSLVSIIVLTVLFFQFDSNKSRERSRKRETAAGPTNTIADSPISPTSFRKEYGMIDVFDNRVSFHYKDGQITAMMEDIFSSSNLLESGASPQAYIPFRAFDNKLWTSWIEGEDSFGENEYIGIKFVNSFPIGSIGIVSGYTDKNFYSSNNRAETIEVMIVDDSGNTFTADLALEDDRYGIFQVFQINKVCSEIRFTIKSAYQGDSYNDTCISEIHFQ